MTKILFTLLLSAITATHAFAALSPPSVIILADSVEFTSSNLPIIVIDTNGKHIRDDERIFVDMGAIDNGPGRCNYLTDPFNDYNGKIAIETRGSATGGYPKGQYRFETEDSLGENLNVSLLGLPVENDWILYGPYTDDQSLIRNVLAYKLSNDIGRYASRTRFCELVLNNDYRGLYILMEKIKRDNDRVDIAEMDSAAIAGDDVTGGYIIKIDKWEGENIGIWESENHIYYQYHYPKADEIVQEQMDYIQNFMNDFETIMLNLDKMGGPLPAYETVIDVPSFIDHFLLNEFPKNVDAYRISAYLYKQNARQGGKLFAGPIWDFNLSFGNAWYEEDKFVTDTWQVDYSISIRPWDGYRVPFWWPPLVKYPAFTSRLKQRWNELKFTHFDKDSIYTTIDVLADSINEARLRNVARWPVTEKQPYEDEIAQMKQWISDRWDFMDANLSLLSNVEAPETNNPPRAFSLGQNYPNPFNPVTWFSYELPENAHVEINIYNIKGQQVARLTDGLKPAGSYTMEFDARHLPSGIYFYKLRVNAFVATRKMLLVR
ncbi:CotH kinase family protein [candidate division KSB1 bacterium]|nr:CotH kinase family protein [candidate division KSB1 bacterium]